MAATTWKTDLTHTDISFSTKHMMVTTVRGKFTEVEGTMTLDEANPGASGGSFTVKAASVSTGAEGRDQHLRGNDFFHTDNYPNITFVSSRVELVNESDYRVSGNLTILDVTRPVTFDVEFLGFYDGFTGRRAGFHATARINRDDFGLTWNMPLQTGGWLVGKDVKLEIDLAMDEVVAEGVTAEPALATA